MPSLRLCIDVDDLDAAVAFYTRAVGFTPGRRNDEWAELVGGPCPIDLLAKPPGTAALPSGTRALRDYERHWTPVHLDANAAAADRFLPVNRIKPHTCFKGPIESGLTKMSVVGFGKQPGAAQIHACGPEEMRNRLLKFEVH